MNLGNGKVLKEHGLARIDGNTTEHGTAVDVRVVGAMDVGL